jgi:hypothetical protein
MGKRNKRVQKASQSNLRQHPGRLRSIQPPKRSSKKATSPSPNLHVQQLRREKSGKQGHNPRTDKPDRNKVASGYRPEHHA